MTPLPGADGPHPGLSSGGRLICVVRDGTFVGLNVGRRQVDLIRSGRWEVVWREGAMAGGLICGLVVPSEVRRNN